MADTSKKPSIAPAPASQITLVEKAVVLLLLGLGLAALVASKTFLFERHNPKKALTDFEQLASDKSSPLAGLAINKLGMLLVSQDPTKAIAAFSQQIRDFPEFPLNGFASLMIGTCY